MYRTFAEREATLFEQALLPYLRQRNPEAQGEGAGGARGAGPARSQLRTALLRQAVRESFGE